MGYCGESNPSVTASLCHLPLRTTPPSARWCEGYTGEALLFGSPVQGELAPQRLRGGPPAHAAPTGGNPRSPHSRGNTFAAPRALFSLFRQGNQTNFSLRAQKQLVFIHPQQHPVRRIGQRVALRLAARNRHAVKRLPRQPPDPAVSHHQVRAARVHPKIRHLRARDHPQRRGERRPLKAPYRHREGPRLSQADRSKHCAV